MTMVTPVGFLGCATLTGAEGLSAGLSVYPSIRQADLEGFPLIATDLRDHFVEMGVPEFDPSDIDDTLEELKVLKGESVDRRETTQTLLFLARRFRRIPEVSFDTAAFAVVLTRDIRFETTRAALKRVRTLLSPPKDVGWYMLKFFYFKMVAETGQVLETLRRLADRCTIGGDLARASWAYDLAGDVLIQSARIWEARSSLKGLYIFSRGFFVRAALNIYEEAVETYRRAGKKDKEEQALESAQKMRERMERVENDLILTGHISGAPQAIHNPF